MAVNQLLKMSFYPHSKWVNVDKSPKTVGKPTVYFSMWTSA